MVLNLGDAKLALVELKDAQVKGKRCGMSPSQDNVNEGKNRGSAFLESSYHQCAKTVFKCLQKRDVIIGYGRTIGIASAESSSQVDEGIMVFS